jgi:hypothetical protein
MTEEDGPQRKSRRDRFLDVAPRRTKQLLRDIRLLGNCGNRAAYEYSEGEVEKIFTAIERELAVAKSRFRAGRAKEVEFSLD